MTFEKDSSSLAPKFFLNDLFEVERIVFLVSAARQSARKWLNVFPSSRNFGNVKCRVCQVWRHDPLKASRANRCNHLHASGVEAPASGPCYLRLSAGSQPSSSEISGC